MCKIAVVAYRGLWDSYGGTRKFLGRRVVIAESGLESPATEGDSPVGEIMKRFWFLFPSSAGHVEPCVNLGGPSPKAKYSLATDSEPVP